MLRARLAIAHLLEPESAHAGKVAARLRALIWIAAEDAIQLERLLRRPGDRQVRSSCRRRIVSASSGAAGKHLDLVARGPGIQPERRDRIGDHQSVDRRIGQQLGRACMKRPCVTSAITRRAPAFAPPGPRAAVCRRC